MIGSHIVLILKFYNNMLFPLGTPGVPGPKGDRGLSGKYICVCLHIQQL